MLSSKILRCLKLIRKIINITEVRGVGSLKSHSCLTSGERVNITVTNDITGSRKDVSQKIELSFNSNTSVFEMKQKICEQFKIFMKEMKLISLKTGNEIGDGENGRSIGDMRFGGSKKAQFTVTNYSSLVLNFLGKEKSIPVN